MEQLRTAQETAGACACSLSAMERPVLIVFDLDGTIADSRELARRLYQHVFEAMGYGRISDELADSFNGPDADEVCRVMGVGADRRALYDQLVDETEMALVKTIGRVFPGVHEMLAMLAPHAVLAILTNGTTLYCRACIEAFGLTPYIRMSMGFTSGVTKAQRIRQWAQGLGARRVIVVGDRDTDVRNAREAGAYAVAVTYGMGSREELSGADALCRTPIDAARACLDIIART